MTGLPHVVLDGVMDAAKSGGWRVLTSSVRALAAMGRFRLSLLVPRDRVPDFDDVRDRVAIVPVDVHPSQPIRNILWHTFVLPRVARRLGADLVHVPTHNAVVSWKPAPVVVTILDITEFHLRTHYDPARMLYRRLTVPRNVRVADHIATISQWVADDITAVFGTDPARITVTPLGAGENFHPVEPEAARRVVARQFGLEGRYVLYFGQIMMPNKNLVRLVEAFARTPEAAGLTLALAGRETAGAELVHEAVARTGLADRVRFLGYVPDAAAAALYSAAEAFAYVSLREGFGLPVVEAMRSGCPVVTSDSTSLREIATGAAELVDPERVDDIARGLGNVLRDPSRREALRAAGFERARQYTWERSAEVLADIYDRVLGGAAGRRNR